MEAEKRLTCPILGRGSVRCFECILLDSIIVVGEASYEPNRVGADDEGGKRIEVSGRVVERRRVRGRTNAPVL